VHEASDALGTLATANLKQARQAVQGRRLLVATRSLPEKYDIPPRYSEPPEPYADSLIACCHDTGHRAGQAAETASEIATRAARRAAPSLHCVPRRGNSPTANRLPVLALALGQGKRHPALDQSRVDSAASAIRAPGSGRWR
jgi:hypothetical protein